MLKKTMCTIIACTTIHANFTGGYLSKPENQVTLPDEKVLTERAKESTANPDFLEQIGFVATFAEKKFSLNQASQKIDSLILTECWEKLKSQIPQELQLETKKQLDNQTKETKSVLLGMLFKDFPEELKKLELKK